MDSLGCLHMCLAGHSPEESVAAAIEDPVGTRDAQHAQCGLGSEWSLLTWLESKAERKVTVPPGFIALPGLKA